MTNCDDPAGALDTYPTYRHQFTRDTLISTSKQLLSRGPCLLHNHPSGDPTPSRADIQMTKAIIDVARPLGIEVHDHIIVGKEGHASLKGLRLI